MKITSWFRKLQVTGDGRSIGTPHGLLRQIGVVKVPEPTGASS
jgi:hypothetical protein